MTCGCGHVNCLGVQIRFCGEAEPTETKNKQQKQQRQQWHNENTADNWRPKSKAQKLCFLWPQPYGKGGLTLYKCSERAY